MNYESHLKLCAYPLCPFSEPQMWGLVRRSILCKHYEHLKSSYKPASYRRLSLWRQASQTTAYFKSSDGHYNGWSFNLRRPNLHVLPLIQCHHGYGYSSDIVAWSDLFTKNARVILVDSTRAGKRMPDSFSKTVPIWCAVINRALKLRSLALSGTACSQEWDTQLHTAPQSVSKSEHSQIEEKLDAWAKALAVSCFFFQSKP